MLILKCFVIGVCVELLAEVETNISNVSRWYYCWRYCCKQNRIVSFFHSVAT